MAMEKFRIVAPIFLVAAYLFFINPVMAQQLGPITAVYSFGASSADTGSYTAALGRLTRPYGDTFFGKPLRFTDGRLILDFLTQYLGLRYVSAYVDSIGTEFRHGANFASAGSTIQPLNVELFNLGRNPFTLGIQLLQFQQFKARSHWSHSQGRGKYNSTISLTTPESLSNALFTFDHGQNDLHAGLDIMTEEEVIASIPYMIDNYTVVLKQLYMEGARSFWIHNVGPIGCLPWFIVNHPQEPDNIDQIGCIISYNVVTQHFNRQLKDRVSLLRNQFRDATFILVDMYTIKHTLVSQGTELGFIDPLGVCCGKLGSVYCSEEVLDGTNRFLCEDPSKYISWDGLHYSDAANKWIFNQILSGSFSEPELQSMKPVTMKK